LDLGDEEYRKARGTASLQGEFFNLLRAGLRFGLHESWEDLLAFVSDTGDDPLSRVARMRIPDK
jgi:hypothetical protein